MQIESSVDRIEAGIGRLGKPILRILLKDRTTGKNIIWATHDYESLGKLYKAECEITSRSVISKKSAVIRPRVTKPQRHQLERTKGKAEVFTPSWLCNAQNNLIDAAWFNAKETFNFEQYQSWTVNPNKINFAENGNKTWEKYVDAPRMEISCGEAPYLVSRYDAVDGTTIPVERRIGLLDRKLRVVNENTTSQEEWFRWTIRAFQSIYGFELQGDNLLLARENLLYTFIDNLEFQFHRQPTLKELKSIAHIISWNIWQMDGLTFAVPHPEKGHPAQYCSIKDWQAVRRKKKSVLEYRSLIKKEV